MAESVLSSLTRPVAAAAALTCGSAPRPGEFPALAGSGGGPGTPSGAWASGNLNRSFSLATGAHGGIGRIDEEGCEVHPQTGCGFGLWGAGAGGGPMGLSGLAARARAAQQDAVSDVGPHTPAQSPGPHGRVGPGGRGDIAPQPSPSPHPHQHIVIRSPASMAPGATSLQTQVSGFACLHMHARMCNASIHSREGSLCGLSIARAIRKATCTRVSSHPCYPHVYIHVYVCQVLQQALLSSTLCRQACEHPCVLIRMSCTNVCSPLCLHLQGSLCSLLGAPSMPSPLTSQRSSMWPGGGAGSLPEQLAGAVHDPHTALAQFLRQGSLAAGMLVSH